MNHPIGRRRVLEALAGLATMPLTTACGTPTGPTTPSLDEALALPVLQDTSTSPAQGVFFGIFRENVLTDVVSGAEADLRRKPAAAMWFTRFGSPFPQSQLQYLAGLGMAGQVTWEPWGAHGEAITLAQIETGLWDAYIDTWARAAAQLDLPFMLRFGHEFNGNWYPWSVAKNGSNGEAFARAYRRVVTRFKSAGAHKVQHVWCFNNDSQPAAAWNDPRLAYPGDDVVDWIGIDGYNFGTSQSWSRWTSFGDLFAGPLAAAQAISPRKPVVLAEMGCSEAGGDKAAWITRMAADLAQMPAVRAFTWFDIVKETSWALTSSDASWHAAIQALRQPHIRGSGTALLSVAASPT